MSSFKKIISVVCAAALTLTMYGVAKSDNPIDENQEEKEKKEVSLNLWYSDEALGTYAARAAEQFREKEGIPVVVKIVSEVEYIEQIHEASIGKTEDIPDVYITSNDSLEKAYLAGLAEPIDEFSEIYTEKNYSSSALEAVTYKGKLTAYPIFFETSFFLYNKDCVWKDVPADGEQENVDGTEAPGEIETERVRILPETIDEILTFAEEFEGREGIENIFRWNVSDIFYDYYLAGNYIQAGGIYGDDEEILDIVNEEVKECLTIYQNLNQFFAIDPKLVTYEEVINEFIEGKTVFTIAKTDAIEMLEQAKAEGRSNVDYGIAMLPEVSDTLESKALSITSGAVVNAYSRNKKEAALLAKYLSYDLAGNVYGDTGKLCTRLGIEYKNPEIETVYQQYEDSVQIPKLMSLGDFWVELEIAFSNIWMGSDIEEEIKAVEEKLKRQIGY